jgi:hypothetical protein
MVAVQAIRFSPLRHALLGSAQQSSSTDEPKRTSERLIFGVYRSARLELGQFEEGNITSSAQRSR